MPDDERFPPPREVPGTWLASDYRAPAPIDSDRPTPGRAALPWVVGSIIVLAIAVICGYGTAVLLANLQHVPVPAGALGPTPRPSASPGAASTPPPATVGPGESAAASRPPVATLPPRATPVGTPRVHVVKRGESLSLIAEQYGVDPQAIIDLNELQNPDLIVPGQELLIPPP